MLYSVVRVRRVLNPSFFEFALMETFRILLFLYDDAIPCVFPTKEVSWMLLSNNKHRSGLRPILAGPAKTKNGNDKAQRIKPDHILEPIDA